MMGGAWRLQEADARHAEILLRGCDVPEDKMTQRDLVEADRQSVLESKPLPIYGDEDGLHECGHAGSVSCGEVACVGHEEPQDGGLAAAARITSRGSSASSPSRSSMRWHFLTRTGQDTSGARDPPQQPSRQATAQSL